MKYQEFLENRRMNDDRSGLDEIPDLSDHLFDYQKFTVEWALSKGRAAIFADTGLGKTAMLLEWAKHMPGQVLIITPLAVGMQIVAEAVRFGMDDVTQCKTGVMTSRITITNYENLHKFSEASVKAVVLDESSILKSFSSKYRAALTEKFEKTQYKLCTTATPAPNDLIEIANHAVFLGYNSFNEIRAKFFRTADSTVHNWRLKGHSVRDFWEWVSTWAIAFRMPSDIGFDDTDHILPPLEYREHIVITDYREEGSLFPMAAVGLHNQRKAKRATLDDRVRECADFINATDDTWLIWCNLNDESQLLTSLITDATEVTGSMDQFQKETSLLGFASGDIKRLVTKPSIAGHGMNWQVCNKVAFVGLSHSFEQMYQAIRRCWRFGQKHQVDVHFFVADVEDLILSNIKNKEKEHVAMMISMVEHFNRYTETERKLSLETDHVSGDGYDVYLGDCIQEMKVLEDNSVDLSVFSPPFPGMYAYSDMQEDMGNTETMAELMEQYGFLTPELARVTKPGRLCCIHMQQLPCTWSKNGFKGRRDWRGPLISSMESAGWIYWSEITIDKNPQYMATRTKEQSLLFKSLSTDSAVMAPAHADYILVFRMPGKNEVPIRAGMSDKYNPDAGWITQQEWVEWASPVWYRHFKGSPYPGIRESDVLNVKQAREKDDEKHLAPLQLGVIERLVKLYSNPGDLVLSPFAGIGSEGYKSLLLGRRFAGFEIKRSYFDAAVRNVQLAADNAGSETMDLFQDEDEEPATESDREVTK